MTKNDVAQYPLKFRKTAALALKQRSPAISNIRVMFPQRVARSIKFVVSNSR